MNQSWLAIGCQALSSSQVYEGEMANEARAAGGVVIPDPRWLYHLGPTGFSLPDYEVDWIEAVANGEEPDPR